jgi:hypothetical protein
MDDFRENWQTMPDEDLRDIYRKKLKEHKRLGTIAFAPLLPALLVYGFMGWTGFFIFEIGGFNKSDMDFAVGRAFYYVGLAVSSALIRTASYKHRWLIFLPTVISILFVTALFGEFSIEPVIMLGYLGYVYYKLGVLLPDLDFLRGLPRFPLQKPHMLTVLTQFISVVKAEYLQEFASSQSRQALAFIRNSCRSCCGRRP